MVVEVKICGVNSIEAADAAMGGGADFAGLNFHRSSPRYLDRDAGRALAGRMRSRLRLVALVCDAADDAIAEVVAAARPDFLQLHGAETPERVAAIRDRFGTPVIKALAVSVPSDVVRAHAYEPMADMLLFDAVAAENAANAGGHGRAFDWRILRGATFLRPWVLAGGLTAENVRRAIALSGASAVDVSSGVESSPGRKDAQMIRTFIASAKADNPVAEERPA